MRPTATSMPSGIDSTSVSANTDTVVPTPLRSSAVMFHSLSGSLKNLPSMA